MTKMQETNTADSRSKKKDVKRFAKAAKTYASKAASSKASARKTLISLGTHTKGGKLTKRYS